jgi:hypothetical protein
MPNSSLIYLNGKHIYAAFSHTVPRWCDQYISLFGTQRVEIRLHESIPLSTDHMPP